MFSNLMINVRSKYNNDINIKRVREKKRSEEKRNYEQIQRMLNTIRHTTHKVIVMFVRSVLLWSLIGTIETVEPGLRRFRQLLIFKEKESLNGFFWPLQMVGEKNT